MTIFNSECAPLQQIGVDWVQDKERTNFAFQAMCWAKSFIPKIVWQAGERTSNLIESVHADVNREGVHCTLLGGVLKGEFYDALQMKTLKVGNLRTGTSDFELN